MPCGVGDYTAILAEEIAKHDNVRVALLTSAAVSQSESRNVQLLPVVKHWKISEIPSVMNLIKRWRPDVVHVQYHTNGYGKNWMPYLLPLFLKLLGLKVIQTWHEAPSRFRCLPNSLAMDALIGVEPDYLHHLMKRYQWLLRKKKTCFIPVGSNIPRIELTESERREIRDSYASPGRSIVAFFGFSTPAKRVESIFQIADPDQDHIILITDLNARGDSYHRQLLEQINQDKWTGKVTVTGFLAAEEVAKTLGAADAAIFPFQNGIGKRNGSFLASASQGTFTITTSHAREGYDADCNVYYALPGDIEAMRSALCNYKGQRMNKPNSLISDWSKIAGKHISLYRQAITKKE